MNTIYSSDDDSGLSNYIAVSRYARHSHALGRRETWAEAVERVSTMHLGRYPDTGLRPIQGLGSTLHDSIRAAFAAVTRKDVLPSMRSLQFGGDAILKTNSRVYNCSFSLCDRPRFFAEAFWLLLCGTGTGFSVQRKHVEQLPALAPFSGRSIHHAVADTIEGWADALDALINAHIQGETVSFDFSGVRPAGSPLMTSGGKAPGPEPLETALSEIRTLLLKAAGRQMRPIECYDVTMFAAKAVLSGGIRRSATICLFSPDDTEMMEAKTGNWFAENPQRSASNNSAVLVRGKATRVQFDLLFRAQKEFGEPGFYFAENEDYGCNPCCEIGLNPVLELTFENIRLLRARGYSGPTPRGGRLTGWQMCNLSTTNGARAKTADEFYSMCAHAAVIGTLQAGYTRFSYLGPVSEVITEREALLGVSICGVLDNPDVLLAPEVLRKGANVVREVNREIARAIGIRPAARLTAIKPEGTASLLLGAGSGIHPHHSRHYFRRVQANKLDPVFRHYAESNPSNIEDSVYDRNGNTAVITFATEGPKQGLYREDLPATRFLEIVASVQRHWVQEGRADDTISPGLHHNVSNTVTVNPNEWADVADFIWENRSTFTGVSLLAACGDKNYAQAPREAVTNEIEMQRWLEIRRSHVQVDYAALSERTDETKLKDVIACAGGSCELA